MRQKKLICIDLRWIDASGVGIYIQNIMPGILSMMGDVEVVGLGDRERLEAFEWASAPNFSITHTRAPRYSLKEQIELPRFIPKSCDLFFSPYYTIPLLYRGRLVATVHDMSHLVVREIISNSRKHAYARLMYWALSRQASLILTVSDFTKSELLRFTKFPADKIFPTHLGISDDWYQARKLAPVRDGKYVVVVGNVKPYKNLPRLIEAFLSLKDRIDYDLVVVGQSEGLITGESAAFFDRVRTAGKRVCLTGKVSYLQLQSLVAHAQALVMPSLYEGFGLPPVEAMAAGVPVLVANAGSLPEVCGDAALYFNPLSVNDLASALEMVARNADLRRQLIERGHTQSLRYRWKSTAEQTAELLRQELFRV